MKHFATWGKSIYSKYIFSSGPCKKYLRLYYVLQMEIVGMLRGSTLDLYHHAPIIPPCTYYYVYIYIMGCIGHIGKYIFVEPIKQTATQYLTGAVQKAFPKHLPLESSTLDRKACLSGSVPKK